MQRLRLRRSVRHSACFENVLGTSLELQIIGGSQDICIEAERCTLQEIDRLEAIFSAYNANSELRRWMRTHGEEADVSPELASLLKAAEIWMDATSGAFNPATELLTQTWREAALRNTEPSQIELEQVVHRIKGRQYSVDASACTARRLSDVPLNLNAIAKGRIIDASAAAAMLEGITEVLVNIGGDIRHLGRRPIRVDIADPFHPAENQPPIARITVENQGVATSGGYRRGFRMGDIHRSHILDPRTGRPVEHIVSATVVAPTTLQADVLSTAFSVLTPKESFALCTQFPDIAVLLVSEDGQIQSNELWNARSAA
jgi:thiamine biosynthesis lipoprotein